MSPSKERAGGTKNTNKDEEVYAAFALYLLGMEVANVDGEIDNAEMRVVFSTAERASEVCSSEFVRRVTDLLAGAIDQKPQSRPLAKLMKTYDASHEDIFRRVGRFLATLKEEDYLRYLETARLMVKCVGEVSANRQSGHEARGRYGAAGLYIGFLSTWVNVRGSDMLAWIEKNGY